MQILTIDFETYYDKQFSLSKLTTEEYIRDPQFEVIGVAVKKNDEPTEWFSGTHKQTKKWLDKFDWSNSVAIAHNAMFDMAILNWVFDIRPKKIADTLSMARAIHTIEVGGSLAALVEYYELGEKGKEVLDALGKKRLDFSPDDLEAYAGYCINDVELTLKLFKVLAKGFPVFELNLIDLTIRMFSEPVLVLDVPLLEGHLQRVRDTKEKLLSKAMVDRKNLMSNNKFAELLTQCKVVPPKKISPTTGKETYAFAKTDEAFKALLEHDNPVVQILAEARLGTKSTLEETRTERFLGIAARGTLPIPLRYYAAHTGRWGGDDKVNMQNLPRKSALKKAICAPEGYTFIDCDLSQIEARMLAWLAGQEDLLSAFDQGQDVYKIMASAIYGKPVDEIDTNERFVGKTTILGCIASGTMVLCDSGWKPIETVTTEDRLWDGVEFVCHQGLVKKGLKPTVELCGSWLTPDHSILCGTEWKETQSVVRDASGLSLALDTGAENLPSQATYVASGVELKPSLLSVIAGLENIPLTTTTSKTSSPQGVIYALKRVLQGLENCIGATQRLCRTMNTALGYSTDSPLLSVGAITPKTGHTLRMENVASTCIKSGEPTGRSFLGMCRRLTDGITRRTTWIGQTTPGGTNPATYGLSVEATTQGTNEKLIPLKQLLETYDVAYAGPRNRFTILTEAGPVIVHNCGYGMGAAKFQTQLETFGVSLEQEECQRIINVYRSTYEMIPRLWYSAGDALEAMQGNQATYLDDGNKVRVLGREGILLPNGLKLRYPNLRRELSEDGREETVYDTRKGRAVMQTRIYGGKVIENVCQALARIVIGQHLLKVAKRYKVVMTVHDAIGCIAPIEDKDEAFRYIDECMRERPEWALTLPLDCEGGYGPAYGKVEKVVISR